MHVLLKSETRSTSWERNWITFTYRILNYDCELYLKQLLTSPQRITIVAYHTSNHRLVIETGEQSTTSISRDK